MARPLRIEFAGATYHVMARGNQGQRICLEDPDRELWRGTLVEAWKRTGWLIHAWALMGNHYHLLLETPELNLVSGMKWLQGTYTHVSQAVRIVQSSRDSKLRHLKAKLAEVGI